VGRAEPELSGFRAAPPGIPPPTPASLIASYRESRRISGIGKYCGQLGPASILEWHYVDVFWHSRHCPFARWDCIVSRSNAPMAGTDTSRRSLPIWTRGDFDGHGNASAGRTTNGKRGRRSPTPQNQSVLAENRIIVHAREQSFSTGRDLRGHFTNHSTGDIRARKCCIRCDAA
jgi:hypothetical protein